MKGKHVSIPAKMIFRRYHCSKCGTKLKKERTHRVVSKDDKDYYSYHEYGTFPRYDHDIYDYRFKCPTCNKRISFKEQCIIKRIQKKCNQKVLSSFEISENYQSCKHKENRVIFIKGILFRIIINFILCSLFYLFASEKKKIDLYLFLLFYVIITVSGVIFFIKRFKGKNRLRRNQGYSHEHISRMERLHSYCSHNKEMISMSNHCYCFNCCHVVSSERIVEYIDENQTALCPDCGVDSIIPDAADKSITKEDMENMRKYWF